MHGHVFLMVVPGELVTPYCDLLRWLFSVATVVSDNGCVVKESEAELREICKIWDWMLKINDVPSFLFVKIFFLIFGG